MKRWILKAVIQKLFGIFPGGFRLNYLFQKYVSKAVVLGDEFFETMLSHFKELEEYAIKRQFRIENARVFEIGTGWHVVVPVCFYLTGADEIVTVDLNSHLRKMNLEVLIRKFVEYHDNGRLDKYMNVNAGRLEKLRELLGVVEDLNVEEILSRLNIHQHIVDASSTHFESGYFHLCYSVNVYEHIHEDALEGITGELSRISREGAYGYHAIGVYDHFSHIDSSISKFNYLRFSKREWRLIDNTIQPQNRLRISYFRSLFKRHGFKVQEEIFQKPEPREIARIPLHPDFAGIDDLDIPYGTFVLEKE